MVAMALGSIQYALLFVCTFGLQYSCGQLQPRISEAFYSEVKLIIYRLILYYSRMVDIGSMHCTLNNYCAYLIHTYSTG